MEPIKLGKFVLRVHKQREGLTDSLISEIVHGLKYKTLEMFPKHKEIKEDCNLSTSKERIERNLRERLFSMQMYDTAHENEHLIW